IWQRVHCPYWCMPEGCSSSGLVHQTDLRSSPLCVSGQRGLPPSLTESTDSFIGPLLLESVVVQLLKQTDSEPVHDGCRAYFYTRGLSGRNLNPAPWFSVALIFYFALGEVFFRRYLQRLQGQMIGGFGAAIPGDL
ncbi:hypothetical protein JOQ06_020314, partial [Pogonophryne albipinna]